MIEVKGLTKQYGSFSAVKDVSFEVGTEHVLGFLGPNGAGKTTVMKILTGYHYPTSGTALIDGYSIQENPVEVKERIGYLPENVPLYGDLTVYEYLFFVANSRLIPKKDRETAIQNSLDACGLPHVAKQRIETLSKGYKQRVGLAQAIIHDPPILILDEPTTGLDPNQIIEIRQLIKELGKRKTVILSTHILQEVEAICSQVLIINEGRIAAQGTPAEIAESLKGKDTWELQLKGENVKKKLEKLEAGTEPAILSENNGLTDVHISVKSGSIDGETIFDWAVAENLKILSMNRKKLTIEDIFVKLTNEQEEKGE